MPELPEVQTTVNGLHKNVLNRTFVDVWTDWAKTVKKPKSFTEFKKELVGKKIIRARRRAKNVIMDLSGDMSLLIHMKMTGHLLLGKWKEENGVWKSVERGAMDDPFNQFLHTIFFLDDGEMIAFSDMRKFAKIELWKTEELEKELEKLGPEPLDKSFTFEKFKERLAHKRGKIKVVLMNPGVIAGIGNIYANEALWISKIHPVTDVSTLDDKELKLLYEAVIKVLQLGVDLRGESFSDYRDVYGKKGDFDNERKVYKREKQKCHRCGTEIKRIMFGGRSSFFCPTCQKVKL
jgi:formamidopyrimidine-DNA glycosylase